MDDAGWQMLSQRHLLALNWLKHFLISILIQCLRLNYQMSRSPFIVQNYSTFIGFNFIVFFGCLISTLYLLGTTEKVSLSEMYAWIVTVAVSVGWLWSIKWSDVQVVKSSSYGEKMHNSHKRCTVIQPTRNKIVAYQ